MSRAAPPSACRLLLGAPFRRLAVGALLTALAGCGGSAGPAPPNVVIVVLDTLRPDRMGSFGNERDTSPTLDALAAESFVFEAAQSPSPWTAPALISLVTSLQPDAHGIQEIPLPQRLNASVPTLTQLLREQGYETLAITEGGYARGDFGLDQGFDQFLVEDLPDSGAAYDALQQRLDVNLNRAERWLDEPRKQPFFLLLHTFEVHAPRIAPEEYVKLFRPGYDEAAYDAALSAAVSAWNERRELTEEAARLIQLEIQVGSYLRVPAPLHPLELRERAAELGVHLERERHSESPQLVELVRDLYDAELRRTDELLNRLWDALRRNGHWDDTLLVVISDHGEGLGDHDRIGHGTRLHEEILRVLLMIRTPERVPGPRRIPDIVRTIDVMPTILELVGIRDPDLFMQGSSLVPLMRGEPSPPRDAFSHAVKLDPSTVPDQHTLRTRDWRLIVDYDLGTVQLFDLCDDPRELVDVSARESGVVAELTERLDRQRARDAALLELYGPRGSSTELDPALRRELEGLGYIGKEEE